MDRLFLFAEPAKDCVTPKASLHAHTHPNLSLCFSCFLSVLFAITYLLFFSPQNHQNHQAFILAELISENRKHRLAKKQITKKNTAGKRFWSGAPTPTIHSCRLSVAFVSYKWESLPFTHLSVTLNPAYLAAFCLSTQRYPGGCSF